MAGITVCIRASLNRTSPAIEPAIGAITVVGILEGILPITKTERAGVATGTMNGCAIIGEGHVRIELNIAIAMIGSQIVVGGVASFVSMTSITVIDTVMTAVQLGIVAVALSNAVDPGKVKITVTVAALRPVTVLRRGAPAPLPGATVIMAGRHSGGRCTGGRRTVDIVESGSDRRLGSDRGATGSMCSRRVG